MMNIEVLDEQLLNSCWLSCSMPLVVLIRVSRIFYESKVLVIEVFSYPKCLGNMGVLEGLELKIKEEKLNPV